MNHKTYSDYGGFLGDHLQPTFSRWPTATQVKESHLLFCLAQEEELKQHQAQQLAEQEWDDYERGLPK